VRVRGAAPGRLALVARLGRKVVARGSAKVTGSGRATVRLRFTKPGRRAVRGERSVRLRVSGGGARAVVKLTR
jgi:hypothetical protein